MANDDREAKLRDALAKIDDDLNWTGPGGRVQAYVLLPRDLALVVRDVVAEALPPPG